jgi:hypothetical protein
MYTSISIHFIVHFCTRRNISISQILKFAELCIAWDIVIKCLSRSNAVKLVRIENGDGTDQREI